MTRARGGIVVAAAFALLTLSACRSAQAPPAGEITTAGPVMLPGVGPQQQRLPPPLPDTTGWGTHVLSLARSPDGTLWAGTYGRGIFVLRGEDGRLWDRLPIGDSAISWGFVNSIAFEDKETVWYGTVGNGFGRSSDGGQTWRNWTFSQLGPEWQYVVPSGIVVHGGTVHIATADGLRITSDGGASWLCVQDAGRTAGGATAGEDACTEHVYALPTEYLLSLDVADDGTILVGHLRGLSVSRDGGRTWSSVDADGIAGERIRAVRVAPDSSVWVASETSVFVDSTGSGQFVEAPVRVPGAGPAGGAPRDFVTTPLIDRPAIATSYGMLAPIAGGDFRLIFVGAADRFRPAGDIWTGIWVGPPYQPIGGTAAGLARVLAGNLPTTSIFDPLPPAQPQPPRHVWFGRPIADDDGNPHIDGTYRYGSTMGGNFQQHQGVEFNNPAGTPVRAIGDGLVVFAGPAEAGANTVAIRHDRTWEGQHVFSTYYHNTSLDVSAGQRVAAGDVIARVGNTGRATNDHLHLEIHVAPSTDSSAIVHPDVRYPPHTVNPQLWIEPLPGTGIVAGRVVDAAGNPVAGARVHGLVLPWPEETPFSFAETYADRAHPDPAYGEHFAVGDVPAGDYMLGVRVDGRMLFRRVRVAPGQVTWVEFGG